MKVGLILLDARVEIARVHIDLVRVEVEDIRVDEPSSSDTQVEIKQVSIKPTLWQGIRKGVWAEQVVLSQPTLHVRSR